MGDLPGFDWHKAAQIDQESKHKMICKLKDSKSLKEWCRPPFDKFKDFATEIENLDFYGRPNYGKLRNMLNAMIHDQKQRHFEAKFKEKFEKVFEK